MQLYYQNKDITDAIKQTLKQDGEEVCRVLFEKMKDIAQVFPILIEENGIQLFALKEKTLTFDQYYTIDKVRGCYDVKTSLVDIDKQSLNPEKLKIAQEIFNDFFIIKIQKDIYDKFGEHYQLVIIENSDLSIGDSLVVDEVRILKNGKNIGYLKAKYNTNKSMSDYGLSGNFKTDPFFMKATTDYSYLLEDFQNKGLGYQMYFHMAQHLNQKNIQFRESVSLSPKAKRIWHQMKENWSDSIQIKKVKFGSRIEHLHFLNIAKDTELYFENKQPKTIRVF